MKNDITLEEYKKCFDDFNIVDCAVRSRDIFNFTAQEDYNSWPNSKWDRDEEPAPNDNELIKHAVAYFPDDEEGERWSLGTLEGFDVSFGEVAQKPLVQHVVVSMHGQVYAAGSGVADIEKSIPNGEDIGRLQGGIRRIKSIDGWLYYCGGRNSVGKRLGIDEWQLISPDVPNPERTDHRFNSFEDIDGFNENDIYCVGSEGQVYHFNGNKWYALDFPTNVNLNSVCCAGDGFVYVSGVHGITYKGKENKWKLIGGGDFNLPFRDMVWYEDRVWCTSDYGVWNIVNDKIITAEIPDGMSAYAGHLSTGDGVLLLAGFGGAAVLENGEWRKIFSNIEMTRMVVGEEG